jgi:hypothetical protein
MENIIQIKNGNLIFFGQNNFPLWAGLFSRAECQGSIIQFIHNYLNKKSDILFISGQCDGNIQVQDVQDYLEPNKKIIIGTLAQSPERTTKLPFLYLPLDDDFFMNGIHFESYWVDWKKRSSKIFWRGVASGEDGKRLKVIKKLWNYPNTDLKITNDIEDKKIIGNRVPFTEFFNYKIFLIIDGNVIASNHMWAFATGCVPIMISDKIFWFQKYLVPFRDYLPVQPDLSDLIERIEWVRNHDQEAEQIAKNAVYFSQHIFSPQFQQNYIIQHIHSLLDLQRL